MPLQFYLQWVSLFLSLYSPLTSCKKSEKINEPFPRKQWKCLFLDQFAQFWAKRKIFLKNPLRSFLRLYSPLTSCKKSEKTNEPFPRKLKCLFLDQFWAKRNFFVKNPSMSFLSLYSPITSCKKSEKTNEVFPRKQWKCLFLDQFRALLGQTRIFPKNPFRSLLSLHSPLTSCKKIRKNKWAISKKTMKMSIFWPIWAILGQTKIFPEKSIEVIFKLL